MSGDVGLHGPAKWQSTNDDDDEQHISITVQQHNKIAAQQHSAAFIAP
jgi:hypothetical protein